MSAESASLAQQLLDAARNAGAQAADVQVLRSVAISVDVRGGALEQATRAESTDLGLRVLVGAGQASVSSSDLSHHTIQQMAERAVAMAKDAPEDPYIGLADPSQLISDTDSAALELCDRAPEPTAQALQDMAQTAEAAALSVRDVSQVQSASAGYNRSDAFIAASNGLAARLERSSSGLSCVAIAGTGGAMERDYDYDTRVFFADLRDPIEIGARAGARCVERLAPRKPQTGQYPVLFDERVSGQLIGHLLSAINGSAIARGSSWARELMNKQILPAGLDLIEDPHRRRISGSRLFDAEGLATSRRKIVADGILESWILDLATGRKLGLPSTANASRSIASPPSPSAGNIALTQSQKTPADLMRDMGTGLWVTSMIGSTINPNTGDYSRGAAGFWVENGEAQYAVNEVTIAGNLITMLAGLIPANDARAEVGRQVPSILVPEMTLAGS